MGVILDTSVLIDAERKRLPVDAFLESLALRLGPEELALATVSVAELEHGIWRAKDEAQQQRRRAFVEDVLAAVPSYPLTTDIARQAGRVDAECEGKGVRVAFQDLVIGVTALHFGYSVLTLNVDHFRMIPNLTVTPF